MRLESKPQRSVRAVGEALTGAIEKTNEPKWQEVKEHITTMKQAQGLTEDVSDNIIDDDSDLYVTVLADFIDNALRPNLIAQDVIKSFSLDLSGSPSVQIPKGELIDKDAVGDLNSDGTLPSGAESTEGFDSVTATVDYKVSWTQFTQQMLDKAPLNLITDRVEKLGFAIAHQLDADIIELFGDDAGVKDADPTDITYDVIVDAIANHRDEFANPDVILVNHDGWADLMKDADMKDALAFATTSEGGIATVQNFGTLRIIPNAQIPDDTFYTIDTDQCGWLVLGEDLRTFDGRINDTVAHEVIALKAYAMELSVDDAVQEVDYSA